jgi:hypothetical protein
VPAKAIKLPVKPFKGRIKCVTLSRVGKCIFRHFAKVPPMFEQRQFGEVSRKFWGQFWRTARKVFTGSFGKMPGKFLEAVWQSARKNFIGRFMKCL